MSNSPTSLFFIFYREPSRIYYVQDTLLGAKGTAIKIVCVPLQMISFHQEISIKLHNFLHNTKLRFYEAKLKGVMGDLSWGIGLVCDGPRKASLWNCQLILRPAAFSQARAFWRWEIQCDYVMLPLPFSSSIW